MPLDPKVEAMFVKARDVYTGPSTSATYANRLISFDKFYDLIRNNSYVISQINASYQRGILKEVVYFPPSTVAAGSGPANPSGRSGFGSTSITQSGSRDISSLSLIKDKSGVQVKKGILYIGDDMIKFANNASSATPYNIDGSIAVTPDNDRYKLQGGDGRTIGEATSLFIVLHEFGHGFGAAKAAEEKVASVNTMLAFLKSQLATVTTINIQSYIQDYVRVAMRGEGRATLYAYNAWVDGKVASGTAPSAITDQMRKGFFGHILSSSDVVIAASVRPQPVQ